MCVDVDVNVCDVLYSSRSRMLFASSCFVCSIYVVGIFSCTCAPLVSVLCVLSFSAFLLSPYHRFLLSTYLPMDGRSPIFCPLRAPSHYLVGCCSMLNRTDSFYDI